MKTASASNRTEHVETVVAVVLLREDGTALLQLRDEKPGLRHGGMWVMPGGHSEQGESLEAAGRREFLEETGYVCGQLRWLMTFENDQNDGWSPYQLAIFWERYDGVQPVRCFEGQALRFMERSRATAYPIPDYLMDIWDKALRAAGLAR